MTTLPTTITAAAAGLRAKHYSATELTKAFLDRIAQVDGKVKALLTVTADRAMAEAKLADERLSQGDASPLLGIPIVYKDNFVTAGTRTTAGSNILSEYIGQYDADVVSSLSSAGAVMLGKANLDAFAHGSSTENSDFHPTHNPWDLSRVPGGSSGGSAAALAAQECLAATGSDTGGSIRLPAAFTNTVGLKPTYGLVSRYGIIAMGSSFDSIGHFTRTVEDCALVLQATAGASARDATTVQQAIPDYQSALTQPIAGLRVGLVEEFMSDAVDPSIITAVQQTQQILEQLGATCSTIKLPHSRYALAAYYILVPSEISANLARFDGIRYGQADVAADVLVDRYELSRAQGLGAEAKRRIMLGTYALSAGYYDAYYRRAQQVRTLVKQDFDQAFEQVDVLLAPVTPTLPFKLGERLDDPMAMYSADVLSVPVNLAGVPSLALPAGFNGHLPVGIQLIGQHLAEPLLLSVGHQLQQQTDWHQRIAEVT